LVVAGGNHLATDRYMSVVRNMVVLALVLVLGCAFVELFLKGWSVARKLTEARRLASRRVTDREARSSRLASETWDGEGGAIPAAEGRLG
jgi:hypothetical protein